MPMYTMHVIFLICSRARMFKYFSICAGVVLLDQATKILARAMLELHQPFAVIPSLNFTLAYNTGAAFSLFANAGGWQTFLFTFIALVAIIIITRMLRSLKKEQLQQGLGLALILGGAVGNLIDRVTFSKVTDFIDVYYKSWHFATFNIADMAISIGAVLVILDAIGWIIPGMPRPSNCQQESSE